MKIVSLPLIFSFFILFYNKKFSKENSSLIQIAVQVKEFNQQFYLFKNKGYTLTISDTSNTFKNCSFDFQQRKIDVVNYLPKTKDINTLSIYKIENEDISKTIYFWCPYSGANLVLKMTKKDDITFVNIIGYGNF